MSDRLAALVEYAEAEAFYQFGADAPDAAREQFGIATARLGGGILLSMSNDPTNYWSRATGFTEPVTAGLIGEAIDFFRAQGTKQASIQLSPAGVPADWDEICRKYGLTRGNTLMKLGRGAAPIEPAATALRIGEIGPEDVQQWVDLQLRVFEMPDGFAAVFAGPVGSPNTVAYAAWDGDDMVASACAIRYGEAAEFCSAATLPEYRGRGAQSALLARRINDGLAAGVEAFSVETGKPAPGEKNSSLNNLRRAGFDVLYERPNWTWRGTDLGSGQDG